MSLRPTEIPLFLSTTELTFYCQSRETHKQILTIYNPYNFPIKFKVLSNAADKYLVVEPSGTIASHCGLDIVIRHKQPIMENCHVSDKFLIVMLDYVTDQKLGKRYVTSILLPGEKDDGSSVEDSLQNFSVFDENEAISEGGRSVRRAAPQAVAVATTPSTFRNYVLAIIGMLCVFGISLPTKCEPKQTSVPEYLHLSTTFQVTLGFIIGGIFFSVILIPPRY